MSERIYAWVKPEDLWPMTRAQHLELHINNGTFAAHHRYK